MKIAIDGKDVNFTFGLYFLGKAQKEFKTDMHGLLSGIVENPLADITDLMFFSLKCNCEIDEIEVPFTKRFFVEYLENNKEYSKENGVIKKWADAFIESIRGHFLPEENKEVEAEKKT